MGLHPADLAALACYFLVVVGLGVWTARGVKDMADFVMPRRFGKVMMIFFGFGAGTHSDQAVSVASKSYTNGVSGIWYQWLWLFCTPFYWLIAPMMRRFRALTTADIFELRYNRSVCVLFAAIGLWQYSVNIGVMLKGSAHVIEASTGGTVDANLAIAIMTVLFVGYGMAGGLHAAILTDFIQGVLTVVFSFLMLPFLLQAIGGLAGMREQVPAEMLSMVAPAEIGLFYIAIITFNGMVGIVTQPHTLANCAAGRTELDGQVGWMCGNFLKRICTIAWTLTGVAAYAYFLQSGTAVEPDNVFGEVAYRFLPAILPGLLGLFLAGLLAAVMSSCDAFMITSAGLFTENIYKPLLPNQSKGHYLWVARLSSLAVVASGVVFAYSVKDVVTGLEIFWKVSPMLGIAFWLGLFWPRMTSAGAWASTAAAMYAWWLTTKVWFIEWVGSLAWAEPLRLVFVKDNVPEIYLPWQMIFYLTAGTATGIVVSLLTPRVRKEKLDRYYALIRTPVVLDEHVEQPCTIPEGAKTLPPRKLIPVDWLEIYMPSPRMIAGFLAGWCGVAALVWVFFWLVKG